MKPLILILALLPNVFAAFAQSETTNADEKYVKEMQSLAKNKFISSAFSEIERLSPTTTKELIMLNEIPAPPFKEGERAKKYKQMLEEAGGVNVWIDSIGNVLALRKGVKGERIVAIDGHLDTVFPEETDVKVKLRGDTLYAPGIGDNARGLMIVLTLLRVMEKANIKTNDDVLFVGTVGEEGMGDLRGVKYLFDKSKLKIASWISIDDDGIGNVNNAGTGAIRYRVTVSGPGGHSWSDFGLANTHHALAKMIDFFVENAFMFTSSLKTKTSFNVGRIGGGTSINAIPFESWMEVDMRSEAVSGLNAIDSIFKSSITKGLQEYNKQVEHGPALTMKIDPVGFRPSGITKPDAALIQRSMAALQFLGITPRLKMMSGNANLPISKGIPAVTLGWGGKGGNAHALDEWWLDEKGNDAIKAALLTLLAEAGVK